MIKKIETSKIVSPKNQLELFGYQNYFTSFVIRKTSYQILCC